jgi:hypothetical protein
MAVFDPMPLAHVLANFGDGSDRRLLRPGSLIG